MCPPESTPSALRCRYHYFPSQQLLMRSKSILLATALIALNASLSYQNPSVMIFLVSLPGRTQRGAGWERASNPEIMFREAKIFVRFFNVAFVPQSLIIFPATVSFRPAHMSDAVGHRSYCSWPPRRAFDYIFIGTHSYSAAFV